MDESIEGEACSFERRPEQLERLGYQQPARRGLQAHRRAVAAPRPVAGMYDELRRDRISDDVRDCTDEIRRAVAADRAGPVSEQVIRPAVAHIRVPRVIPVQLLESARERLLLRLHDEVMVI